jgi:ABC-2 type transport system ATP-binding protein
VIQARNLTRSFGDRIAVDSVSFNVEPGQICVLLGPNGAGKTTTVRMLSGLIRPSSGSATVAGVEVPGNREALSGLRAKIGLLTETPGLYDRLTAIENLTLFGRLYGMPEATLTTAIERHLTTFGLFDRRHDPVGTWSKGMRQKLAIVRTIFHDPEILFFDEPTAGLDPESSRIVRELIASLRREGRTLVVLTHNLAEATELADTVGVIRGKLLAFGPPQSLRRDDSPPRCRITLTGDASAAAGIVRGLQGVVAVESQAHILDVELRDAAHIPSVVEGLVRGGFGVRDARAIERSLEDVYLDAISEGA